MKSASYPGRFASGLRHYLSIRTIYGLVRRPGLWLIVATLVLITVPHYGQALVHPAFLTNLFTGLGLTRHSFERVLYLAPIIWGAILFGRKGAIIISFVAIALMLPYAFLLSTTPLDDIFEISAVFIMGNVVAFTIGAVRGERERRIQLEASQQQLKSSEERYRSLFENAIDAIWIHDMQGNIIAANRSDEKMTGFSVDDLLKMNVRQFLSEDSLKIAHEIREKLTSDEPFAQPYEQRLTRKDGSEAIVQLVTSLVLENGVPVAFQNIARDITEQKRLQENIRSYSLQLTRMMEQEKARMSHDVYEEVLQVLTAHGRQLDTLASSRDGLSEANRARVEAMLQQINNIVSDLHRMGSDLRPPALDLLGFVPALRTTAAHMAALSGIEIKVNVVGEVSRLPKETELVIYRIAEEALRNTLRHSRATEAEITVEFGERTIKVTVSDNGSGSDLPRIISDLVRDGKLGLTGMQERAELVGGTLTIQSQPGRGTSIRIELPSGAAK